MGAIFDDDQLLPEAAAIIGLEFGQTGVVDRIAAPMDEHQNPRIGAQLPLDIGQINVQRLRIDVGPANGQAIGCDGKICRRAGERR